MGIKCKIIRHNPKAFACNTTIFYGEKDAVMIDPPFLLSDAYKLAAEIITMRVNLTYIYVSHFHPDHHFGLYALKPIFPNAKIVALAPTVHDIVDSSSDKVDMWSIDRFGAGDIPPETVIPHILRQPYVELEGERIEFYGGYEGDSSNNTVVWVPSLRVLCTADIVLYKSHMWTVESNVERRKLWRRDIARLKEFNPRVVVPGHTTPSQVKFFEDIVNDETASCVEPLDWAIEYLEYYEEVYNTAKNGAEMVNMMLTHYDLESGFGAVHTQTRMLFPQSSPEWLNPLPGKPGEIFLNPQGEYDGDPPKEPYLD